MVLFWHLSENSIYVVRHVFKFLFQIYNVNFLQNNIFELDNIQAGLINHICFSICSTYILISPAVEQSISFWDADGGVGAL